MIKNVRRCTLLLVLVALSLTPGDAAAPWFLIFHDGSLKSAVTLSDWHENQLLMVAIRDNAGEVDLTNRPYIQIAYFWGPDFAPNARNAGSALRIEDANQRGRFYPAHNGAEAVVTLNEVRELRAITSDGLALLRKYGIPIRLP